MVLIIFMQVVLRWFHAATVWAEELARYIMLYQVWIGASYAVREDAHIRITALIGKLTGNKRHVSETVVLTLWLIFALWLTVEGVQLVKEIAIMGGVLRHAHPHDHSLRICASGRRADEHPSGAEADPGHERRPPRGDQGGGSLKC